MARIRSIKPEYFKDEELHELGIEAALLFQGLWMLADREGRLEDRPRRIKVEVLPYYDIDAESLLGKLADAGFIQRYEVNGQKCIQVTNFLRHQMPSREEPASELPAPDGTYKEYVKPPNETVRQRLYRRDHFKCAYCEEDMTSKIRSRCLDHVIPFARGGSNTEQNLVTCCKKCNEIKRSRTPLEANMPWPEGFGEYADNSPLTPVELSAKHRQPPVNGVVNGVSAGMGEGEGDKPSNEGSAPKGAKPSRVEFFLEQFPESHRTPEFREAIAANFRMRIEKKLKPLLESTMQARGAQWGAEFTVSELVAAFRESTLQQYDGVFPKKARGQPKGRPSGTIETYNHLMESSELFGPNAKAAA